MNINVKTCQTKTRYSNIQVQHTMLQKDRRKVQLFPTVKSFFYPGNILNSFRIVYYCVIHILRVHITQSYKQLQTQESVNFFLYGHCRHMYYV